MLALLVPQALFHVSALFLCVHLRPPFCLYMTDLGALVVRHGVAAGTQRQSASATRKFYSDFNTVFVPFLLLAAGVGFSCCLFLMSKMFCLLKYNQSRIAQARDKQIEEN